MILGLGPMELVVILLVVLVIFGPKNLPKLIGKTVKNVREGMEEGSGDSEPAPEPEVARTQDEKDDEAAAR